MKRAKGISKKSMKTPPKSRGKFLQPANGKDGLTVTQRKVVKHLLAMGGSPQDGQPNIVWFLGHGIRVQPDGETEEI
jgi:hypothetical protein